MNYGETIWPLDGQDSANDTSAIALVEKKFGPTNAGRTEESPTETAVGEDRDSPKLVSLAFEVIPGIRRSTRWSTAVGDQEAVSSIVEGDPAHATVFRSALLQAEYFDQTEVDVVRTVEGLGEASGGLPLDHHHGMSIVVSCGWGTSVQVVTGPGLIGIAVDPGVAPALAYPLLTV